MLKNICVFLSILVVIGLGVKLFAVKKNYNNLRETVLNLESKIINQDKINNFHVLFNYKKLPIEKNDQLDFLDKDVLSIGKKEMAKHKAVFVGIARDNADHLAPVMRHMEYLGESFADYRVIIFENDSSDATKIMLNIWKLINPKVEILSENFHNTKRPSIKFLAEARNKYVEALRKTPKGFDIIIPMDMDMANGIDIRGLQDSFNKINQWDVVCSNGTFEKGKMYDAFAFRDKEFPYSPEEYKQKYNKEYWDSQNIGAMQKIFSPNMGLIPVYSCFGGFAVYKRELFENCSYDSIEEDCEHVALHQCMRLNHNARIFMNAAQIIRYY